MLIAIGVIVQGFKSQLCQVHSILFFYKNTRLIFAQNLRTIQRKKKVSNFQLN